MSETEARNARALQLLRDREAAIEATREERRAADAVVYRKKCEEAAAARTQVVNRLRSELPGLMGRAVRKGEKDEYTTYWGARPVYLGRRKQPRALGVFPRPRKDYYENRAILRGGMPFNSVGIDVVGALVTSRMQVSPSGDVTELFCYGATVNALNEGQVEDLHALLTGYLAK